MKVLLIGLALAAAPTAGLACSPVPPPELTPAEQLQEAKASAEASAASQLAERVRAATDISVVSVAGFTPGPEADIPPNFRMRLKWYRTVGLQPVRYQLKTERTIKGAPPAVFPFTTSFLTTKSGSEWGWAIAPNDDMVDFSTPRSDQSFWSDGRLTLARFSAGPGDCSNQFSLDPATSYLVFRDPAGKVTAAEPVAADDPLPDLIAALVANPAEPYPWRPTVAQFLALSGYVSRVKVIDCNTDRVSTVEVLRDRSDYAGPKAGMEEDIYGLVPSLHLSDCREGAEYIMTGWPTGERLHPVVDGVVQFEDRWMQLRFTGEKSLPLQPLRQLLNP